MNASIDSTRPQSVPSGLNSHRYRRCGTLEFAPVHAGISSDDGDDGNVDDDGDSDDDDGNGDNVDDDGDGLGCEDDGDG